MDDYHRLSQSRLLQVLSAHIAAVYCSCVTVCVCECVFWFKTVPLGIRLNGG